MGEAHFMYIMSDIEKTEESNKTAGGVNISSGDSYSFGGAAALRWYRRLSPTSQSMFKIEIIVFSALLALGVAIHFVIYPFERPQLFIPGLILGCATSALKIVLLEKALANSVSMGRHAAVYGALQAFLRYFVTIAVLVPAFMFRAHVGIVGVVAGLLSLQVTAFITTISTAKKKDDASV